MKKLITLLLALTMLVCLAACGSNGAEETPPPEAQAADPYLKALSYVNGTLATVEEFNPVEGFDLDLKELKDNSDVVSTEYKELYAREAAEGSEFKSTGKVFAFGYDENGHMRMAKVFALNEEGGVLFTYVIFYQLDEHGNFTGWTHMTEAGDVLLEMTADLNYDGDKLTEADYHYTRYGQIAYTEGYPYEALEPASADSHVVFEY